MKILEIITSLGSGGAERFVVDLCNKLSERNEVVLLLFYPIDKSSLLYKEISSKVSLLSLNKKVGFSFSCFLALYKAIKNEKPDIVHTHLSTINYSILSFLFNRRPSYIHTIHSDALYEAETFLGKIIRKIAFNFNLVKPVTISIESQRSFEELYHVKSFLIFNGRSEYRVNDNRDIINVKAELESLKKNKDSVVLINVARVDKVKNQLALAKAVDFLNKKNYKVELFNLGEITDPTVVDDIMKLNSPYVHLLGLKSNPRDYIKVADAFFLSSTTEGMPISLIECFSVGTLPICTPVGGILNMVKDGFNGLLSRGCTPEDLEEVIIRFLNISSDECLVMKTNSLASFNLYDMQTCFENYLQLMQSNTKTLN